MAIRWSPHARENLTSREIEEADVLRTVGDPERVFPGHSGRVIHMRTYHDRVLDQKMLLCVVAEHEDDGLVIVTIYKTSKLAKYIEDWEP